MRKNRYYRIIVWIALISSLILLWQLSAKVINTPQEVTTSDHWRYWIARRLTVRGENPYDPIYLSKIRDEIPNLKYQFNDVPILLTPPWTILLITPFAPINYTTSRLLWLLVSIVMLVISANALWKIFGGVQSSLWAAWLLTFTFAPTIFLLRLGQINPWTILGLVGFLHWCCQKRNDWLAGISLALISIKPQIFFLFWIALIFGSSSIDVGESSCPLVLRSS